ncbi:MAG: bifunctional (p)ppGpp synthetase/guanosine-3',5'-bis(diphosphate) 3'-pyrophosphohydrolase [Bacteroidetes bacterium]|nr:bifunctional (p)ppGpp synthetase/guanosine-3',5'-bis(diphosphate) 3'-pyrophosphohydrolase [Bacteroidota bacterium]
MKNKWAIDELQDVWQLATKLHDGQKYGGPKDGEQIEYINHIGSVTFEVINAINNSEDMNAGLAIKCAVLHDTLEDTKFSYEKAKELFGKEVADGTLALTKSNTIESSNDKMLDSLKRIKQQPKEIWAVKMADRICNLYEPPFYWKNEKKLKYIEEAKLILAELKDGNNYLAERLESKTQAYHRFLD